MKRFLIFKTFLLIAVLMACSSNPAKKVVKYHYLSYLPKGYDQNIEKKWPLIIFLHGASLRGNDLEKVKKYGIPKLIEDGQDFEFVIISPQCPSYQDWTTDDWFTSTFNEIIDKYHVDTTRVYLTGMSLGGEGTWFIAEQYPEKFAAIAPVCGRITHISNIQKDYKKLSRLPIWIFHGAKDKVYSVEESDMMYKMLKEINDDVQYTRYPELGHGATHDSTYRNSRLYQWFLTHQKRSKQDNL